MTLGTLYIVATPIGNLEDISLRSLRVLKEVDYVLCEDTRLTKRILDKYELSTPTISYHQHSNFSKIKQVLQYLKEGKNLALVSDAGTPGISDPGSVLVHAAFKEYGDELKISPIPGPSAVISALSVSGWPVDRFSFFGFLPHKKGRQTMIKEMLASPYPVAFYESKHRLAKCLKELDMFSKEQDVKVELMIARELTKMFESLYFGAPSDLLAKLEQDAEMQKGEFVVLLRKIK
jgi:16S rRNA (cytidine1402-2'-O)-methyltransferase